MSKKQSVSRREFLKTVGAASTAFVVPTLIPASALGRDGHVAPSNRIVMGAVGVGGMGTGDLRGFLSSREVQVVAVCDVDARHRNGAKAHVNGRYKKKVCEAYLDYRELIGRSDLDAVTIATPDHWHALPAVAAARAGLDIHCQKPLTRSIREGRAICDAVHRYGVVWQTGSQQRSDGRFRYACELVRNGRIGKVTRVEVGLPGGHGGGSMTPVKAPDYLDWNFWLGPAPWRPFCRFGRRAPHWDWRWIMDFSGGQLTDWAGHHIDIAHWGLGLERTGPIEIEGQGVYPKDGYYDAPMQYKFDCRYGNGVVITVSSRLRGGAKWYGDKGWVYVTRGRIDAHPKSLLREVIGPGEIHLYRSPGHRRNFLECIRTRSETVAPVEIAHRSISVGLLGEIAMLTRRKIRWDPDKEQIVDDAEAANLLGRSYRQPWVL